MENKAIALLATGAAGVGLIIGGVLGAYVHSTTSPRSSSILSDSKGDTSSAPSGEAVPPVVEDNPSGDLAEESKRHLKKLEEVTATIDSINVNLEQEKLKNKNLEFALEDLKKKVTQHADETKAEHAKHTHTQDQLQKSAIDLAKAHTIIRDLHKEKDSLTSENVHLKNDLEAANKTIQVLKHEHEDEARKLQQTEAELIKFKDSYDESERIKREQANTQAGLLGDINSKLLNIKNLEAELGNALLTVNQLRAQLQSESDLHRNNVDELQGQISALENENALDKEQVKQVNEQLFNLEQKYKEQVETNEKHLSELRNNLKSKEDELEAANAELAKLKADEE